jgi:glycosyltransferase family protein
MKLKTRAVYLFNRLLKYIYPLNILNTVDSINYLLNNNISLARYGDGELNIIMGADIHFQKYDKELADRLVHILSSDSENLKIGIPLAINTVEGYNQAAKFFWNMNMDTGRMHWIRFCGKRKQYLNASLTRCYIDYEKKEVSRIWFQKIKLLWDNKKILIVEGSKSKLGVNNSLFSNTKSIARILCPSINAWSAYDEIYENTKKYMVNYDFVLVSLGPTATVLVNDISKVGCKSIDIGHLNLEYNKYIEESHSKVEEEVITEDNYLNQIIYQIL